MDVLIVENDAIVAKVWSRKLSKPQQIKEGDKVITITHTVRIAESVERAKEEIASCMPDLVLLDLRLNGPKHSGLQVYEYIRRELNDKIPIIFITGLAYSAELFQHAEGFVDADNSAGIRTSLVEKPVYINDLTQLVNAAVA